MRTYSCLILALLLLPFTFSCSSANKDSRQQEIHNKAYSKGLEISIQSFPEGMLDHFPEVVQEPYSMQNTFPKNDKLNPSYGSTLLITNRSEQISELKQKYNFEKNESISFIDDCTLIVNDTTDIGKNKPTNCSATSPPIPNFPLIFNSQNKTDLQIADFDIYILSSKSGQFIDEYYLSKSLNMPKEWEHGYSKGVAMNEKQEAIIYWAIIW